jgi:hypothetical protein
VVAGQCGAGEGPLDSYDDSRNWEFAWRHKKPYGLSQR